MAYIDKMHIKRSQVGEFFEYLKSIDKEFKEYFINAPSILEYTYYNVLYKDVLTGGDPEEEITVSNFPTIVDRWLAHREDLPHIIKEQLEYQYSDGSIFTEPIYNEYTGKLSHKFTVTKWTKCDGRRWTKPIKGWCIKVKGTGWRWYPGLNKIVHDRYVTPDLLGHDWWLGPTSARFKSLKAVFRFLNKHGFPTGTEVLIRDWRYNISKIHVRFK